MPTKIKIVQDLNLNERHANHPINIAFSNYKEFNDLVFKGNKKTRAQNIPAALEVAKKIGL